jgi:zinc protease
MDPILNENNFTFRAGTEPKSMVNEMSYFDTPYSQEDEMRLNLLSEIVNNRITDIIREKMSAIYGGGVGMRLSKFPKERFMMQSFLPCGPENAVKVKDAFWDIIQAVKKDNNITADEFQKATETALQKYKVGIQSNNFWLGTMEKYQQYNLPMENMNNFEERVKAVTIEQLSATAKKYLSSKNVLHAVLMPE